jgi:hypothetical protein
VEEVVTVSATFVYHVNVPVAQDAFNVALEPLQIDGEFKPVGAAGIGVTVTKVLAEGLLQVELEVLIHAA